MNAIVGYDLTPEGPRSFGPASVTEELLKMTTWSGEMIDGSAGSYMCWLCGNRYHHGRMMVCGEHERGWALRQTTSMGCYSIMLIGIRMGLAAAALQKNRKQHLAEGSPTRRQVRGRSNLLRPECYLKSPTMSVPYTIGLSRLR
jgi:hypothetical protein